jgi:F-type H+-transporting ATPase subunit alpha
VICIYVSIGKKTSDIKSVEEYLKKEEGFRNTLIVAVTADAPPTVGYLAPYAGMAIAEYFRDNGMNSIVIFDDMTTHAKIYREISLLMRRTPGRTAYPGDIFSIHAALLERAGNIKNGDGQEISVTALPVATTPENDISGYIQTNLMAITDGHIFFDLNEFRGGRRPAINAFLSVSRVGNQTKKAIDLALSDWIRKQLAESRRAGEIAGFGVELPEETKKIMELGDKISVIFNQGPQTLIAREFQLLLFGLLMVGFWEKHPPKIMDEIIKEMMEQRKSGIFSEIEKNIQKTENLEDLKALANYTIPYLKNLTLYSV